MTVFNFTHPSVLSALLLILSASRLPRTRLSTVGSRAFDFGPSKWNDFPLPLPQKPYVDTFQSNPKTFLFPKQQTCHLFRTAALLSSTASSPCQLQSVIILARAGVRVRA